MERRGNFWMWRVGVGLYFFYFLLQPVNSFSQTSFERTYGGASSEIGYSVQQTQDGGYIVGGKTKSFGAGKDDVYLIRTDSLGDTLWTRTYGGADEDRCYSLDVTQDGGFILTGSTRSFGLGNWDVYVIRTNPSGDTLWTKTFGRTDWDWGYSVREISDGGYILTGYTTPIDSGDADVFLIRMNLFGDTLWMKTYGDTLDDVGYSVQLTRDGGYIITGVWSSSSGLEDIFLIKTDSIGDTLWVKTYGGIDSDFGYSVQEVQDGGYIIAGETISFGSGSFDIYLLKTDSLGSLLWQKTYGGSAADASYFVRETLDGGYILTGSFRSGLADLYVIRTDSSGESLWTKTFGGTGSDIGYSVHETTDRGYIISGYTDSFGDSLPDVYLIKIAGTVAIEEEDREYRTPNVEFLLNQNQPNPFHNRTLITYVIPSVGTYHTTSIQQSEVHVQIRIYDLTGRLVETLVDETQEPGIYQLPITSHQLPGSGIYLYRLQISQSPLGKSPAFGTPFNKGGLGDFTTTKKLILLR